MPHTYTVSRKTGRLMFHDNICKCEPIFKFLYEQICKEIHHVSQLQ